MIDIYQLQRIALGIEHPSPEEIREIAQELMNREADELYRVQPSEGSSCLVYGKGSR